MKYIKKYEQSELNNPKYKKGDHVVVNFGDDYIYKGYCIIFKSILSSAYGKHKERLYEIEYFDKITFELKNLLMYLDDFDIDRKMTKDEIEDLELTLKTNKYNL